MENKNERKKLKIIEASDPKPYGKNGGTLIKVKGESNSATIEYTVFRTNLFEYFKVGAILDCEVEGKQNGEYFNYTINQVYIDGQPVGGKKQGQFRDTSDQVRAQCITQLRVAGVIDSDSSLYKKLYTWLDQLGGKPAAPTASKPTTTAGKPPADKPDGNNLPVFETAGKLLTYYTKEKGMTTVQICQKLGIKTTSEIKDIADAVKKLEGK